MDKVYQLIKVLEKAVSLDNEINVWEDNEVPNYSEYFTAEDNNRLVNMINNLKELAE